MRSLYRHCQRCLSQRHCLAPRSAGVPIHVAYSYYPSTQERCVCTAQCLDVSQLRTYSTHTYTCVHLNSSKPQTRSEGRAPSPLEGQACIPCTASIVPRTARGPRPARWRTMPAISVHPAWHRCCQQTWKQSCASGHACPPRSG